MDITALFDNVDSAEHALVNLQSLGIFPTRYKIRALHISDGMERSGKTATPAVLNMLNYTSGPTTGGEQNREVQLLVTVEDSAAHRAQSALISNHARRVRAVPPVRREGAQV
jgi:hypothetical protein